MDYIREAIEKLEEYDQLYTAVDNLREEIRALNAETDMIKAQRISNEPKGVSSGEPDDRVCNNIAKKKELTQRLEITQRRIRQIESVFEKLDPEEKRLIEILYVQGGKGCIERACEAFYLEKTQIYKMRYRVTKKVAKLFLGIGIA